MFTPAARSFTGPLGPEGQQAVAQLLDAVMSGAAAARQHGRAQLIALVSGLPHRLAALGALSPTANMHVFTDYSVQLLDLLPKQGTAEGGCTVPGCAVARRPLPISTSRSPQRGSPQLRACWCRGCHTTAVTKLSRRSDSEHGTAAPADSRSAPVRTMSVHMKRR